MKRRYKREGREVLLNGQHYATAKDEVAASNIVLALEQSQGRTQTQ